MHVLLLTYAVPAIVVVVMETASPQAESAVTFLGRNPSLYTYKYFTFA